MTIKEYNEEFGRKISRAMCLIMVVENAFKKTNDYEGVMRELRILGWSDEMKDTLLKALECYRVHEGIEKLEGGIGDR